MKMERGKIGVNFLAMLSLDVFVIDMKHNYVTKKTKLSQS